MKNRIKYTNVGHSTAIFLVAVSGTARLTVRIQASSAHWSLSRTLWSWRCKTYTISLCVN